MAWEGKLSDADLKDLLRINEIGFGVGFYYRLITNDEQELVVTFANILGG